MRTHQCLRIRDVFVAVHYDSLVLSASFAGPTLARTCLARVIAGEEGVARRVQDAGVRKGLALRGVVRVELAALGAEAVPLAKRLVRHALHRLQHVVGARLAREPDAARVTLLGAGHAACALLLLAAAGRRPQQVARLGEGTRVGAVPDEVAAFFVVVINAQLLALIPRGDAEGSLDEVVVDGTANVTADARWERCRGSQKASYHYNYTGKDDVLVGHVVE